MKFRCTYFTPQEKTVARFSGEAFAEAERIIKKLKAGEIKFEETAANSVQVVVQRNGGDLGWQDEHIFHADFGPRVLIGTDTIGPWVYM